jgi:hypothetical protein
MLYILMDNISNADVKQNTDIQYQRVRKVSDSEIEYRKIQGLVGEHSLSFVLPKKYATDLGIVKGDYVKVSQRDGRILIEKA